MTFFQLCLDIFSTLVPIDNLWHYSAYTPKKSAFYANWFGNSKQLNKKNGKLYKKYIFQLCLCIFSTLITNVLFKKPFPLCAFSLKKSASISISLGYHESFRKKSFSNSDRAFFQLWSRGRVSKKYHAVLHFH